MLRFSDRNVMSHDWVMRKLWEPVHTLGLIPVKIHSGHHGPARSIFRTIAIVGSAAKSAGVANV
jgi:hypothetical protein